MQENVRAFDELLYASSKIIRLSVDLINVTLRFTGESAKGVAALVAAHMKNSVKKDMGEITVRAMVKRKEPFDMIAMESTNAAKFRELAKQVGLLYSIRQDNPDYDKMQIDGLTSILYRQQDAPLVRSILERLHINTLCSAQTTEMRDQVPNQAMEQDISAASQFNNTVTGEIPPSVSYGINDMETAEQSRTEEIPPPAYGMDYEESVGQSRDGEIPPPSYGIDYGEPVDQSRRRESPPPVYDMGGVETAGISSRDLLSQDEKEAFDAKKK